MEIITGVRGVIQRRKPVVLEVLKVLRDASHPYSCLQRGIKAGTSQEAPKIFSGLSRLGAVGELDLSSYFSICHVSVEIVLPEDSLCLSFVILATMLQWKLLFHRRLAAVTCRRG